MSDFRNYLNKQLENPDFQKEWDYLEPEYNTMQAMIDARKKIAGITLPALFLLFYPANRT